MMPPFCKTDNYQVETFVSSDPPALFWFVGRYDSRSIRDGAINTVLIPMMIVSAAAAYLGFEFVCVNQPAMMRGFEYQPVDPEEEQPADQIGDDSGHDIRTRAHYPQSKRKDRR